MEHNRFEQPPPRFGASTLLSLALIALLLPIVSSPLQQASFAQTNSSSSSSCPPADILHFTVYGGVPTTFNTLGAYNPAGFFVSQLQYLSGGFPEYSPLGVPQNYTTAAASISHNSNYTQWTVGITPGLTWSNGQNVSAQDYVNEWSSNFALNPATDPLSLHSEITSVSAINSSAVSFLLNQSDAWLPEKIDDVLDTFLYPQSFTSQGSSFNGYGTAVTEGPFYVSNYAAGSSQVILLRNPYYRPQPTVCEIVWNFVEAEAQDATYIASGTSDLAPIVPGSASTLAALPNVHILDQPGEFYMELSYNVTSYPYNMTAFRQALAYGINESALVQNAFNGYASAAYSSEGLVPNISSWYNPNQAQYSFDQNKSLQLLSTIGMTKGSDGFLHYSNGTVVSLSIFADDSVSMNAVAAQFVQNDLRSLGFNVNLQLVSTSTLIGYMFSNDYGANNNALALDTSSAGFPGDPFYDAQPGFLTVIFPRPFYGIWEHPNNAQAEYESNLTALTGTNSPSSVRTYLNNIQALNAQYLPAIPLLYGDNVFAYTTQHFVNWPTSPNGYMFESYFWNDTALASLQPSSPTTSATSVSANTNTTTSAAAPTTSAASSSTTTTSGATLSNNLFVIVGVIAAVVSSILGTFSLRRRRI